MSTGINTLFTPRSQYVTGSSASSRTMQLAVIQHVCQVVVDPQLPQHCRAVPPGFLPLDPGSTGLPKPAMRTFQQMWGQTAHMNAVQKGLERGNRDGDRISRQSENSCSPTNSMSMVLRGGAVPGHRCLRQRPSVGGWG